LIHQSYRDCFEILSFHFQSSSVNIPICSRRETLLTSSKKGGDFPERNFMYYGKQPFICQYFCRFRSRFVPGMELKGSPRLKSFGLSLRPRRFSRQPMHKHPPRGSIPAFSHTASRTV